MQTKLTLRLEDALIERAKSYAARTGQSVSELVAKLFAVLEAESAEEERLPPITRALRGILAASPVSEDDYRRHLENKHE
jgi:hypothetical protein